MLSMWLRGVSGWLGSSKDSRTFPPLWGRSCVLRRRLHASLLENLSRAGVESKSVVVDLGCGDRPYHIDVAAMGGRYVGVDLPTNTAADVAWDGEGDLPSLQGQARVVLSTQVLEHVPEPMRYLKVAANLLEPDGALVLSTHGHYRFHGSPTDYFRWTASGLRLELERAGFEILSFDSLGSLGTAACTMGADALLLGRSSYVQRVGYLPVQLALLPSLRLHRGGCEDGIVHIVRARRRVV